MVIINGKYLSLISSILSFKTTQTHNYHRRVWTSGLLFSIIEWEIRIIFLEANGKFIKIVNSFHIFSTSNIMELSIFVNGYINHVYTFSLIAFYKQFEVKILIKQFLFNLGWKPTRSSIVGFRRLNLEL